MIFLDTERLRFRTHEGLKNFDLENIDFPQNKIAESVTALREGFRFRTAS
jgi:hypothetical protein